MRAEAVTGSRTERDLPMEVGVPLTVVCLKALGDFVIAAGSLKRIRADGIPPPGIVAASHLRGLASAIGLGDVRFVAADGTNEVPAAFDLRRRGWVSALGSLKTLRAQLSAVPDHGHYLFDRIGWRERYLVPRPCRRALPRATNIYHAYELALRGVGHALDRTPPLMVPTVARAVIIPGSRLARKTIPSATIASLHRQLSRQGIAADTVVLEGDRVQVPADLPTRTIPRNFPSLIDCLRASDLVISADSLAAHLAEFVGTRCFVVGPRPNVYWLPPSCLQSTGWCLFDDVGHLGEWLGGARNRDPAALHTRQ